jgi:hypothetical protein
MLYPFRKADILNNSDRSFLPNNTNYVCALLTLQTIENQAENNESLKSCGKSMDIDIHWKTAGPSDQ